MNIWSTKTSSTKPPSVTKSKSSTSQSKDLDLKTNPKNSSVNDDSEKSLPSSVDKDQKTFENLGLTKLIYDRIKNQIGLIKPTKVQAECIPALLQGKSCIAHAPTGTGKTLAFGIPMIQKWGKDPYGIFGLILTPTRELALQIRDQILFLGGDRAKVALVIGGVDFQQQALELFQKPSFIVATPGRLLDHLESAGDSFKRLFQNCRYLVYDEVDKLLDGQFDENLDLITSMLPKKKQVMFFSATMLSTEEMVEAVQKLSQTTEMPFIYDYQEDGDTNEENSTEDEKPIEPMLSKIPLTQKYIMCPKDFKDGYLMELLRSIKDNEIKLPVKVRSMIVFAATIRETQVLSLLLSNLGFENTTLHSHLDQKSRGKALSDFRSCRVNTLVATDVVSRGLDIRTVDLVINYSIPMPPDYVHRVGRTGRAGQPGLAIMFVVPTRDILFLTNVENYIGEKLTELKIDEGKVLKILTDVQANRRLADLAVTENDPFEERAKVNQQKKIIEAELEGKPLKDKRAKKRKLQLDDVTKAKKLTKLKNKS